VHAEDLRVNATGLRVYAEDLQPCVDDLFMHGDRLSLYVRCSNAYVVGLKESQTGFARRPERCAPFANSGACRRAVALKISRLKEGNQIEGRNGARASLPAKCAQHGKKRCSRFALMRARMPALRLRSLDFELLDESGAGCGHCG
jgi:hypothetical protein